MLKRDREMAEHILDGFLIHYNFFGPHLSLVDRTPAWVAGIKSPMANWTDVVRQNKTSLPLTLRQKTPFGF